MPPAPALCLFLTPSTQRRRISSAQVLSGAQKQSHGSGKGGGVPLKPGQTQQLQGIEVKPEVKTEGERKAPVRHSLMGRYP